MNQGDNIKKILKQKGKTQAEFAEFMGKQRSNMSKMLNQVNLDPSVIKALSDFLEMDFEELEKMLYVDPEKSDYVTRLEESLMAKDKIITLLEDQLALYKKLEKERERSSD